jgi:hypothetical protein
MAGTSIALDIRSLFVGGCGLITDGQFLDKCRNSTLGCGSMRVLSSLCMASTICLYVDIHIRSQWPFLVNLPAVTTVLLVNVWAA